MNFIYYLEKAISGQVLSKEDAEKATLLALSNEVDPLQIAAFLTALKTRGETVDEIVGAASAIRKSASMIKSPPNAVDCCGTGGDGSGTYNISTAVALVSAACGVPMAKHGNRAASSKSGAADVLEEMGVNLEATHSQIEAAFHATNFAFMMAPQHHKSLRNVADLRKSLGFRTLFNIMGPMANPAGTKRQLIGVFSKDIMMPMAQALKELGSEKLWLVHGRDGLDEITLTTKTDIVKLENGVIEAGTVSPEDFGLKTCNPSDLNGGDAKVNAAALHNILSGAQNAYADIVCANAAAVLVIADKFSCLKKATKAAQDALKSGQARDVLNEYTKLTLK